MSGVAKGAKKVFKKVAKVTAKVLPLALAAGAILFTAGSAMGAGSFFAGGWSGAVSTTMQSMGVTGTLGNVLTEAVSQAGYGAALGLAGGALTGKPLKGAQWGAAAGAVTGAVTGAMSTPNTGLMPSNPNAITQTPLPPPGVSSVPNVGPIGSAVQAGAAAGAASTSAPASSGLDGILGGNNSSIVGGLISGLGEGLMNDDAEVARANQEAALERDQAQRDFLTANYSTSGRGLMTQANTADVQAQGNQYMDPSQRFDPSNYDGMYVRDPQSGKITWMPNQPQATV